MTSRRETREQEIREGCVRAWNVLLSLAPNAECIAYSDLAERAKISRNRLQGKSEILRRIHLLCNTLGFGPLDVLAVRKEYWVPSPGYRELRKEDKDDYPGDDEVICSDRQRVKKTDWAQAPRNLTPEDFAVRD